MLQKEKLSVQVKKWEKPENCFVVIVVSAQVSRAKTEI